MSSSKVEDRCPSSGNTRPTTDTIGFAVGGQEDFRMAGGASPIFHSEGDVIAYSTTISSDERLKENVHNLSEGLDVVLQLRPVKYEWVFADKPGLQIGLIAQEVQKIAPDLVREHEVIGNTLEYLEKNYPDDKPFKKLGVDYEKLTVFLINAVQEQQDQINEIKKEIKELKNGSS